MQNIDKEINQLKEEMDAQEPPKFTLLSHQELIDLDVPPTQWIMNLMIPNPGLVVISGKPGSFKTFFAQWLGLRASAGLPVFDEFEQPYFCSEKSDAPMGKIPTLFIEEENTKSLMKTRAHGFKVFEIGEMLYMIDDGFKFIDEVWRAEVLKIVEEKKIKLLILDPFSSVMGLANENDNAEVSKVLDIVRKEFVKLGLTVVLIHHPSKADGAGAGLRGAGDILGKCDVHLNLDTQNEEGGKVVQVNYQKLRVADRSLVTNFKMSFTGSDIARDLRFRYLGEAKSKTEEKRDDLSSLILEAIDDGEERAQKDIAELVEQKPNNAQFRAVWKKLIVDKQILMNETTKLYHIPLTLNPAEQSPQAETETSS